MTTIVFLLIGLIIAAGFWQSKDGIGGKIAAIGILLGFFYTVAPGLVSILLEGFFTGLAQQSWLLDAAVVVGLIFALVMVAGLWRPTQNKRKQ